MPSQPLPTTQATHQAALDEVVTLATDLARRIHAAATQPQPTLSLEQASVALDRTARTLRRTVLLAQRLPALAATPAPTAQDRVAARKQVIREVEDAIYRAARERPDQQDSLVTEFDERLETEDFEDDLAARPVADIIQDICRDLALTTLPNARQNWKRRTPAEVARLATRARAAPPPDRAPALAWPTPSRSQSPPRSRPALTRSA